MKEKGDRNEMYLLRYGNEKVNESKKYFFYKCSRCHFWTSRDIKGRFPEYDYSDAPTVDSTYAEDYDKLVEEAVIILEYKFKYAGVDKRTKGRFLDVGCSEGSYVKASQLLGWESVGFEVDEAKVARCQARGLNVTVPCYDVQSVCGGYFDFIMLRHSVEHIPNFMEILNKCVHLLDNQGILCIETPNQGSVKSILTRSNIVDERYCGHVYPPTHINGFEKRTYKEIAKSLGMQIVKMKTYSSVNKKWTPISRWSGKAYKKTLHAFSEAIGYGDSIAVFLTKAVDK